MFPVTSTAAESLGGRTLPWALAIFAACLAASCAAELQGRIAWDAAACALFVVGLALGTRHWLTRGSGRIALFVAAAALGVGTLMGADPLRIAASAASMSSTIVLMLCIALLRPIFVEHRLDTALASVLARAPAPLRPAAILIAAAASSLGLSFGAVGVLGATLSRRADPAPAAAHATMRGLVLSMLIGPSTASVAAVMASFPGVSWGASLAIGAPLAGAGALIGAIMTRPIALAAGERETRTLRTALGVLAAEFVAALFAHLVLGLSMTLAISLASAAVAFGCIALWQRHDPAAALERADKRMRETWRSIMPETALFLACGLLVGLMQTPVIAEAAKHLAAATLPGGALGIGALLLAMPVASLFGIHPMVPFAVLSPVIPAALLGITDTGLYALWIVGFMLAMLVSPVSVLTMVTSVTFDLPGRALGVRGNGLFAAVLAAAATLLIAFLGKA